VYTELEIVNHMLFTVGEGIKNTLVTQHPSVVQARAILASTNKDFQGRGWWFNRENEFTLAQDENGNVALPTDTMECEIIVSSTPPIQNTAQYVVRAQKIYDTVNHTFNIGQSLLVNLVIMQSIPDLPHKAATYLKHLAAETMFMADDGDEQKIRRLKEFTATAWHQLKAEELKNANVNALNSPAAAALRYRIVQAISPSNPRMPGGR
jgi:hypothetical protein